MKTFKHFSTLMLAVIMLICSVGTTAFAAENNAVPESATSLEFEITPEMMSMAKPVTPSEPVDDTFYMTGAHTGSTRQYIGNTLRYQITVTDANGNPAGNILSVQLYDSFNSLINEQQLWANGAELRYDIPISYGSNYHFKYALAYGDMRTLRIRMVITTY